MHHCVCGTTFDTFWCLCPGLLPSYQHKRTYLAGQRIARICMALVHERAANATWARIYVPE